MLLEGPSDNLRLLEDLIRHFDRPASKSKGRNDESFQVKRVRRNGRQVALKGAEALLQKMLDLPTSEDALLTLHPVRILSDESSNVLILQGPASRVR